MGKAAKIVAGAVVAGIAGGFGGPAGASWAFSWAAAGGSLALGGLSYALSSSQNSPLSQTALQRGTTVTLKQPHLSRQYVYGHTRVTRGYAHMQSTGVNGRLHSIIILSEGELRSINEIWLNDYCIPPDWIDSNGNVTQGRYAGNLVIRKHLGAVGQVADPLAVSNMGAWTSDHRLDGIAYLYVIMTKEQDIYPTGVPNISAVVEGMSIYDPRVDGNVWTTNIALQCNDFLVSDRYGFSADTDDIDFTNVSAQANICDEIVDTENEDFNLTSINISTNRITLSGDVLSLQFGDRVQIVKGTISSVIPSGLEENTDYYVIPYQVKTTPRILLATSLENSMNKVAIDITSSGSGVLIIRKNGEPRYHGGGVIDSETSLTETLNNLCNSMAGRAINTGGFWTLLAGAWRSPVVDLGISDFRGTGLSFKSDLSRSDSYNVITGLYSDPRNMYQVTNYPTIMYQQFIDDDAGIESQKEINLPYTTRHTTAQRIAKIELFRGRQGIVVSCGFSMKAFQVQPGDVVSLTVDRVGWEQKEFEVTEFSFDVNGGNLIIYLTLRETAQQIYDWSQGEAIEFDPAPNTNLPNPFLVSVPTGVGYNSRPTETRDGDVIYTMQLQWDLHPDQFVTQFGDFEIQFKPSSSDVWLPSFFVDGLLQKTDTFSSSVNNPYDIRIRARNNLGVRSNWVTIYGAVVGSSGGVTETLDWGYVYESIDTYNDWGGIDESVDDNEDWGYVN